MRAASKQFTWISRLDTIRVVGDETWLVQRMMEKRIRWRYWDHEEQGPYQGTPEALQHMIRNPLASRKNPDATCRGYQSTTRGFRIEFVAEDIIALLPMKRAKLLGANAEAAPANPTPVAVHKRRYYWDDEVDSALAELYPGDSAKDFKTADIVRAVHKKIGNEKIRASGRPPPGRSMISNKLGRWGKKKTAR